MLIVDLNTLQAVYTLYFSEQVILCGAKPFDLQDIVRIYTTLCQLVSGFQHLSVTDFDSGTIWDQISFGLACLVICHDHFSFLLCIAQSRSSCKFCDDCKSFRLSRLKQLLDTIIETGYSRLPVYDTTEDDIKGIIYSKDLLPYIGQEASFDWHKLMRRAYFVPETKMIDDLLEEFRTKKIHMAIVVDEFGGTSGIVTMEDILEEIVGDISDEYDEEEKNYTKIDENTYIFEGKILLNDFYKITGLDENEFGDKAEDAETLAGLILDIKEDFPKIKEQIDYGRCQFIVLELDKRRIGKVKVIINSSSEE